MSASSRSSTASTIRRWCAFALDALAREHEVVAAAFVGGTEKVDAERRRDAYGVPVVRGGRRPRRRSRPRSSASRPTPSSTCPTSRSSRRPTASASPASRSLRGVEYRGADFTFTPPRRATRHRTPTLGDHRHRQARRQDGRLGARRAARSRRPGATSSCSRWAAAGPPSPSSSAATRSRSPPPTCSRSRAQGVHAASDNYEDAVMSRVTTVGCRRCGGGMAGETFFCNVPEGARLADTLGKELHRARGLRRGDPAGARRRVRCSWSAPRRAPATSRDYFGPYRLALRRRRRHRRRRGAARVGRRAGRGGARRRRASSRPDMPVVAVTFRPRPIEPVDGRRVFFATTAPRGAAARRSPRTSRPRTAAASSRRARNLVGPRARCARTCAQAAGTFDVLLTELKAAAIDVVAAAGEEAGVPTVLCDNVPVARRRRRPRRD